MLHIFSLPSPPLIYDEYGNSYDPVIVGERHRIGWYSADANYPNRQQLKKSLWQQLHKPDTKVHGANNMGPGPRCAPCWPHEPCYLGIADPSQTGIKVVIQYIQWRMYMVYVLLRFRVIWYQPICIRFVKGYFTGTGAIMRLPMCRDVLANQPGMIWINRSNGPIDVLHHRNKTQPTHAYPLGYNVHNVHGSTKNCPDSKVHGANMDPTCVLSAPDGPHVDPMNLAIRVEYNQTKAPPICIITLRDMLKRYMK